MKSLKQLWSQRGDKTEIKVTPKGASKNYFFVLIGITPRDKAVGWDQTGFADTWAANYENWEIYQEPEELVDHWNVILKCSDGSFFLNGDLYSSLDDARGKYLSEVVRLATEYPPIKLPRKK